MTAEDIAVLLIGDEEWPFAIPVVREGNAWYFDTEEGREEILDRRIGQANDDQGRQAGGEIHLHLDGIGLDPRQGGGA